MSVIGVTRGEKTVSGALTLGMHLLFAVLLVFGVAWQQKRSDAPVVVDLWSNLPPAPQPKVEAPPPQAEPEPEPPKPAPAPKVETKPQPKPDIALKEKAEKERKRREDERQKAEAKKREDDKKRLAALKEQQAKEKAEAKRLAAREQEDALKKLAQQQATAQNKLVDEYIGKIRAKIQSRINKAGCASLPDPEVQLKVTLLPGGDVLAEPEVQKKSGSSACDSAVIKAVLLAQPLPLPQDPALFPKFRELNLNLYPNR